MGAWGRLGAAHGTATPTADGHISGPFSFPPPLLPPLSPEQHFPTLLPLLFLLRGRMEKGVGEGWGREGVGRGSARAPPLGGPRPRRHRCPSPIAGTPARGGYGPRQPVSPSFTSGRVPSRNSWEGGPLGPALHPVLRGPDSLSAGSLLPWPQAGGGYSSGFSKTGKVTPNGPKSLRRVRGGMQVSGREVSFRGWESEFSRMTVSL